jgi:hypothetical protein
MERSKDNMSLPAQECPSPLLSVKHNFSSEHYVSHSKKEITLSIEEQEDESIEQSPPPMVTKSEHVIDLHNSTIEVSLTKKISANDRKEPTHHSTIKVKKIEPQPLFRE